MQHPLWTPSPARIAASRMDAFRCFVNQRHGVQLADYPALHAWSVEQREAFWQAIVDFFDIHLHTPAACVLREGPAMPDAQWFPGATLNFAEHLLRRRDGHPALVAVGEDGSREQLSHAQLAAHVAGLQRALREAGVGIGDRVAAFMPNTWQTVVGMLASACLGATWSSCSPDFGTQGVIDRFGQIEPKVLIAAAGYRYAGKNLDLTAKLNEILERLPSLQQLVVVPYSNPAARAGDFRSAARVALWQDFYQAGGEPQFTPVSFEQPLYILYSSGTTGVPKCIVHGVGGTLLQHLKELGLHTDLTADDTLFYYTTCGWMMWNWLVSGLASEATLLLFDGSPFAQDGQLLWDWFARERGTHFGTSAKYLDAAAKQGLAPARSHDLRALRAIFSTGSPLVAEGFDYVYRDIKADVQLSSISGGTDIVSCFALGSPVLPVYRGELQCRGLGMAVDIWNEAGQPVREEKGELVCTAPFPSMPIGFWNDPDGSKYHHAYFARFADVWCHGDFAELTAHDGMVIYGRSDAVLNPGGVRIGTAEIYRQVERVEEVLESLACGQRHDGDERVLLFVKLRPGVTLDDALRERIARQIRQGASPRHVPARIVQVADIPKTLSGKIVELAVKNVIHGEPVNNLGALANPEALEHFRDRAELRS